MPTHRFAVGDRVAVLADRQNNNLRPGIYTIVRALPPEHQRVQYRARNSSDDFERTLDEAQLRPA